MEDLIKLVRESADIDVAALRAINGILDLVDAGTPTKEIRQHASNLAGAIAVNTPFKVKGGKTKVNK